MNSQDLLNYVRDMSINPQSHVMNAFNIIIDFMFEQEKASAGVFVCLNEQEIEHLTKRQKLEAVRSYKNRTYNPLMSSKRAVEAYMLDRWGVTSFDPILDYEGVIDDRQDS